jgi:hypothetical protein
MKNYRLESMGVMQVMQDLTEEMPKCLDVRKGVDGGR